MITFPKLGNYGRLGNQLFQYAFIRSHAHKISTRFWCPNWDGDLIFDLNDSNERTEHQGSTKFFYDQGREAGYCASAHGIVDSTEIQGFFQSARYFKSRTDILNWYKFKPELISSALSRFPAIDFQSSVSVSLRIDTDYNNTREFFPLYPLSYYERALLGITPCTSVVVFADRPDLARGFFSGLSSTYHLHFIENTPAAEQLYLMSICGKGNIITNSTFAWWGAYLNACVGAKIFTPAEWTRPGIPHPITSITPDEWHHIRSLHPVFDHFQFWRIRHPLATLRRIQNKLLKPKG